MRLRVRLKSICRTEDATGTHERTATSNGSSSNGSAKAKFEIENPLHRLTPEQIEQIGKEFDELHEQVKADLGERDATYIRSMIDLQRRLALLGRALLLFSRFKPAWVAGTTRCRSRRSSRTWRSGTTSCTASGTG